MVSDLPDHIQISYTSDDQVFDLDVTEDVPTDASHEPPTLPSGTALEEIQVSDHPHAGSESSPVGLSDPKLSEGRRRQLDVINRLHNLGAQQDIDIPEIVVIGSQSAGKSSLIESISGITLPRASGTCTRCPIECRLVHSTAQWQCTVHLRYMVDAAGNSLESVKNIQFGSLITMPNNVEERLRRAQLAILNPSLDPRRFLEGDHHHFINEVDFTENCVSVEIKGPDVTDLSFVDLPGLIASVSDGGRDADIEKVQQLISSYISKPRCIILLTVACETDFQTQGAYSLAKKYDRNGTRTIGVLTKPDRIPEGEEPRWMSLITDKGALQNGWFCVKQPSSRELEEGVTFLEARRRSDDFFMNKAWSVLGTTHRKRLGSQAVAHKLNEFLMNEISERFPELMLELRAMLQKTREQLQKIPMPNSNDPVLELMHLISDFSEDVYRQAEGFTRTVSRNFEETMSNTNHFEPIAKAHETFRKVIETTAPNFLPADILHASTPPTEPSYPPSLAGIPRIYSQQVELLKDPVNVGGMLPPPGPIDIDEVVERVRRATTRELPGHYPFHVIQDLISRSTDQWEGPARQLVDTIHSTVVQQRNNTINKYFGKYTAGGLHQTVSNLMHEHMQQCHDGCMGRITWLLGLEACAFTLNKDHFDTNRNMFLASYKEGQRRHLGRHFSSVSGEPWNPKQFALEIMATVRAYFEVASKRAIDTIPLAIDRELVRVRKRAVQDALSIGLKITTSEAHSNCQRLLAEPAEVIDLRLELQRRLVRLQAAQTELESV